jgi:hypothetical protein
MGRAPYALISACEGDKTLLGCCFKLCCLRNDCENAHQPNLWRRTYKWLLIKQSSISTLGWRSLQSRDCEPHVFSCKAYHMHFMACTYRFPQSYIGRWHGHLILEGFISSEMIAAVLGGCARVVSCCEGQLRSLWLPYQKFHITRLPEVLTLYAHIHCLLLLCYVIYYIILLFTNRHHLFQVASSRPLTC